MKTIGFLHQDVPREIIASLAQHDFTVLPPTDRSLLMEVFCGIGHPRVLEKAFNKTKNVARRSANVKLSRRAVRYWIPSVHRVLSINVLHVVVLIGKTLLLRSTDDSLNGHVNGLSILHEIRCWAIARIIDDSNK